VLAAGVGVFGVLFVTVAARIVGIVGVSSQPTSGIALVTLLGTASIFAAAGWVDAGARAGVLTVGTIVAIAASKAGDISQDLKTGWLVGATPARQQLGQLIGAAFACWAVAGTVLLLGNAYEFGSKEIPAPQATLMKTIIEGVLAGALPWGLVLTGAGLAIGAMLCGVSGLAFAIGVYLPLATMAPLYLGGCVRALAERGRGKRKEGESDPGVLAAHFGGTSWSPRVRLHFAKLMLDAGQENDALAVIASVAEELAQGGHAQTGIAILKKVDQIRKHDAGAAVPRVSKAASEAAFRVWVGSLAQSAEALMRAASPAAEQEGADRDGHR
jgi:hypothetical protein